MPVILEPMQTQWDDQAQDGFNSNQLFWDERVPSHWRSQMYQQHAQDLRAGGVAIDDHVIKTLGDLTGQSAIHLQCHMGMETLSLERLGAITTVGIDFSKPALEHACALRDELGLSTTFHCCNVYDTLEHVDQTFDLVFVSLGALCWLPDVPRWAALIGNLLHPGGRLYFIDSHPMASTLDYNKEHDLMQVHFPYFQHKAVVLEEDGSYASSETGFKQNRTVEWNHPIGEVVTALIRVGLVIDSLDESNTCCYKAFENMTPSRPGWWQLPPALEGFVPFEYTLQAHKA